MTRVKNAAPVAGSPAAEREQALTQAAMREIGADLINTNAPASFTIPAAVPELVSRAKQLNNERESDEVELSAILHKMAEDRIYAQFSYSSLGEYAESELEISGSKAREMAGMWQKFIELGLKPNILSGRTGVMFSKFKMLGPAIADGKINKDNIAEWIPLTRRTGDGAATRSIIEARVRELRVSPDGTDNPTAEKRFSFNLPADQAAGFLATLESLKEAWNAPTDGAAIHRAITAAAAAAIEGSTKQTEVIGLIGLSNMMARLAPVAPVMVALDESLTFDNLGVHCIDRVYGSFRTDKNPGRFCLASSKASAAALLGIPEDSVREFKLALAPELMPTVAYTGGLIKETPEIIPVNKVTSNTSGIKATDLNRAVNYRSEGEVRSGTIAEVDFENEQLKVKSGRGRPRSVPFGDVISVSDEAPASSTPEVTGKRAKKSSPEFAIDISENVETACANLDTNRKAIELAGTKLVEVGQGDKASLIQPHYKEASAQAAAVGFDLDQRKALAASSTARFCERLLAEYRKNADQSIC